MANDAYIRQSGAIPLRNGRVCLITSSNGKRWVIPKGLIDPGHTAGETALQEAWEEWEIPREPETRWPDSARSLLSEWWRLRRERQHAIDASIARRADTELLYDQPFEDSKRIRVTGPFTVESLSPHRVLAADENMDGRVSEKESDRLQDFGIELVSVNVAS